MVKNKIWFITGASSGIGLETVTHLLKQGYKVAATSRNVKKLQELVAHTNDHFLPLELDVTSDNDVKSAIEKVISHFGRIDVVVNNAGYGQYGFIEEVSDDEARQCFNVCVFGTLNVLRHTIPYLRKQGGGRIINISSKGGFHAGKATGIYCGAKYAVEGISEALYFEMKNFNIYVTAIKPGGFRTNFSNSVLNPKNTLSCYHKFRDTKHLNQNQTFKRGDPKKAAIVMEKISKLKNPPLHVFLGSDAYDSITKKFNEVITDAVLYKELATSTDLE